MMMTTFATPFRSSIRTMQEYNALCVWCALPIRQNHRRQWIHCESRDTECNHDAPPCD
jgi:hypothetical protein